MVMGKIIRVVVLVIILSSIIFLIVFLTSRSQIVSPVPEEGAIRIIYVSPSPTVTIGTPMPVKP